MKQFLLVLIIIAGLTACKKGDVGPVGPAGAAGLAGPQGPQGIAGNANVLQYSYGAQNLSTVSYTQLQVTTTQDTMNKSAWFVYLYYQPIDRWYFIPGLGSGATTNYRVSMGYITDKVNLYIDKVGPGENYAGAKVIRIFSSGQLAGGRSARNAGGTELPDIDFNNYETVRKYYHLPE